MHCRFCDLETKPENHILESLLHTSVIFSNPRIVPGHLLVIPKRHVLGLSELNEAERKELFDTTIKYQKQILEKVATGCDMKQNNRPFIPENDLKVDHVHFHLHPASRTQ